MFIAQCLYMVGSWVILSVVGIVIFLICLPAVICLYFRIEFICTRVGGSGTSRDFPTTRRQWGCRLKSEFSFFQSLSQLFLPSHFVKWRRTLLELNSPSTERETEFRRRLFTSSIKRGIRHFHAVVLQKRAKKCTKKRGARAKLLLCL